MLAELLLILAGHPSSLLVVGENGQLRCTPALAELLHPGEIDAIEFLTNQVAARYRRVRDACERLSSASRYVAALCRAVLDILRTQYERLIIDVEARVLQRDSSLVASGSTVPMSSLKATFSTWVAPLAALCSLFDELEMDSSPTTNTLWFPGPLLNLLLGRGAQSGVKPIASIFAEIAIAVQHVWKAQLACFILHGAPEEFATHDTFVPYPTSLPSCLSSETADSIAYIGRSIAVVRQQTAKSRQRLELPRDLTARHAEILTNVMPQDRHEFDEAIAKIRTNVSEWLWNRVLTRKDVEETIESLADYFLLRNGEFSVALIREVERLKHDRLTKGFGKMIREQDLQLVILRASVGTMAQQDPTLNRLRVVLPSGPHRPLLPTLSAPSAVPLHMLAADRSTSFARVFAPTTAFNDLLLGAPMDLSYTLPFPLDLFLQPSDLRVYGHVFALLSSVRRAHMRVFGCWSSLSNSQRMRRRWTGLGEGGDESEGREEALRSGWGVVRKMTWFLDTLLSYLLTDVVDEEFRRFKGQLWHDQSSASAPSLHDAVAEPISAQLDFTALRRLHSSFLERIVAGCLLVSPGLSTLVRSICEVCERFVGHVERWGGDVLPDLLAEGSVAEGTNSRLGDLVRERFTVVQDVNESLSSLLEAFYEQLSTTTSQPLSSAATGDASVLFNTTGLAGGGQFGRRDFLADDRAGVMLRRLERLALRLDYNSTFSAPIQRAADEDANILADM
ncbi:Spc98 family-domain-containing protein [Auriculariales sp. MPI-PUGE-AT-0066]|nr:Spc98 family-domain-containing protein [Auriculariales sp. MPI-PUGE-AT-0066]